MTRILRPLSFSVFCVLWALPSAWADIAAIANPGGTTTEIGARIRWARTGFEASLWDSSPILNQNPLFDPTGQPVWQLNQPYKFEVSFNSATGILGLGVDFNRDNSFAGESIERSLFTAPPLADYTGFGFNYISITGNESGNAGRSTMTNLVINGKSVADLTPNGLFLEQYYGTGAVMKSIVIAGDLTFTTAGTSDERPTWNFNFKNSAAAVPDGGTTSTLLGMSFAGLAAMRRFLT